MSDFLTAFGLVLVFEGVLYGGFPAAAKRFAAEVAGQNESLLRSIGIAAMLIGVCVVWLARG
jgi:uncharacterized protein YjeT (DUF2065 family)